MNLLHLRDIAQLPDFVLSFLSRDEIRNNIPVGVLERLQKDPRAFPVYHFYIVAEESRALLYGHHMPSFPLILSEGEPRALPVLVQHLQKEPRTWTELFGSLLMTEAFLRAWPELGKLVVYQERTGLFRLNQVIAPARTGAVMGLAASHEVPALACWLFDFCRETGDSPLSEAQCLEMQSSRYASDDLYVMRQSGELVAMAVAGPPLSHGRTIGHVYTPPRARGRGYASELVAALSQLILDAGYQYCALFTQLANPTSNKIYQSIGYQWVDEFRKFRFQV